MVKRIRFYLRCIKIVWQDRETRNTRQKWRRLSREFEKLNRKMGLAD